MKTVSFPIDDYTIELYAVDRKGKRTRWGNRIIRLCSGGTEVAQAVFSKDEKEIFEPYHEGNQIHYFAPVSQYPAVLDLLRNEKSVHIAWKPILDPKESRDGDAYFVTGKVE